MNKLIKRFNTEALKLSWVYIIAISLLFLVIVQLYRNVANPTAPTSRTVQLEQKLAELESKLSTQQTLIESLEKQVNK